MKKIFILIAAMAAIIGISCQNSAAQAHQASAGTDSLAEEASLTVDSLAVDSATYGSIEIIDFYATWCGPCKRQAPILEELEKNYEGMVTVNRIDIDKHRDIAHQYGVTAVPTLFIKCKTTGKSTTLVGLHSAEEIQQTIESLQ